MSVAPVIGPKQGHITRAARCICSSYLSEFRQLWVQYLLSCTSYWSGPQVEFSGTVALLDYLTKSMPPLLMPVMDVSICQAHIAADSVAAQPHGTQN